MCNCLLQHFFAAMLIELLDCLCVLLLSLEGLDQYITQVKLEYSVACMRFGRR